MAVDSFVPTPDTGPDRFRPAALAALAHFPVTVRAITLAARAENVTYRVDATDGAAYVLRLHRPGYHNREELVAERVWLAALAAAGSAVPDPVPATDGRPYIEVTIDPIDPDDLGAGPETRHVGLARWVPGQMMGDLLAAPGGDDPELVARCYHQLGTVMAALHAQAAAWTPPPGFTRHRLDADGLMGEAPFWGRFWDSGALSKAEGKQLRAGRDHLHGVLSDLSLDPSVFSMIHADLHIGNVLIDGERLHVIDFDDAGFGWHGYDIAVALFHVDGTPDAGRVHRSFFAGYRARRPLAPEVEASLPLFLLIRRLALIGWKYDRPEVEWTAGYFEQILQAALAGLTALGIEGPGGP